ncbi:hypothetical protein NST38_30670 [Paenibacillus sp. FSL H8-0104]
MPVKPLLVQNYERRFHHGHEAYRKRCTSIAEPQDSLLGWIMPHT